ncbi:capsular biosynthesis protein, partial [Vibrio parahaemolyticus]
IIAPSLESFDEVLSSGNVDYIGTRLHGGVRALQKKVRTLILAIDNRAWEKKKDFNLPVVERNDEVAISNFINN